MKARPSMTWFTPYLTRQPGLTYPLRTGFRSGWDACPDSPLRDACVRPALPNPRIPAAMPLQRKIAKLTYPFRNGCKELWRMRFGYLGARDHAYRRKILESGLFDAAYYTKQYPRSFVPRIMPLRHFILRGEKMWLAPGEKFNPALYVRANPDVRDSNVTPLRHYLTFGKDENRPLEMPDIDPGETCLSKLPVLRKPARPSGNRIAVAIHLFYYDLWDSLRESLSNLTIPYDLFVTISLKDGFEEMRATVLRDHPDAMVIGMPNQGRDIFPFLHILNSGLLDDYAAVCKLHTKKSPHRIDGEKWRDHLVGSILPPEGKADELVRRILADPDVGFVVADGQVFSEEKWWGCNRARTRDLLLKVGIDIRNQPLSFPAGSIYWVTAPVLQTLRGLRLHAGHFEPEDGQLDGTLAHVIERCLGFITRAGGLRIDQVSEILGPEWVTPLASSGKRPKIYAFYLPQFHPIPENDTWWGKGFTEWYSVTRAQPNFEGHQQPKLPTELGFYDLRLPHTLHAQSEMAAAHGVDAFCVYFYWFDGKRLLEKPVDGVLENPDVRFPFFFCWANERWTRSWDGMSSNVLIDQKYEEGFEHALAADLARYFSDPRYERCEGKPKFVVYRPNQIPDLPRRMSNLRKAFADQGFPKVDLGAGLFHAAENDVDGISDIFDHFVEIPPHGLVDQADYLTGASQGQTKEGDPPAIRPYPGFHGLVYDYTGAAANSLKPGRYPAAVESKLRRGVMLGWDNTPRRGMDAHIAWGCNPASFRFWFRARLERARAEGQPELYINAWNEWAEGTVLEPDQQFHDAYLRTILSLAGPSPVHAAASYAPSATPAGSA